MRTMRTKDLAGVYAYPRVQIARLVEQGAVVRVAHGYAVAVPDDQDSDWKPTVEEAAAGITAARIHQAIPRALGNAVIAVPRQHRPIALEGGGKVLFVARAAERLDARLETLESGRALVTTLEQTMLDLAKRPTLGGHPRHLLRSPRRRRRQSG